MARLINPTLVILIIHRHSLRAVTSSTPLHLTRGETWAREWSSSTRTAVIGL